MSRHSLRFGNRFAGTGLGQQPTIDELYGLQHTQRARALRFKMVEERLRERVAEGDEHALYRLKKLKLAQSLRGGGKRRKKPTKVGLKFLENDVLEDVVDARIHRND